MNSSPSMHESNDEPTKTPSNSRLMITKMVLENFKSYAGVKEIGPFHQCFSAVVGPNGSGKSNVIDALLFVFGKRAKKLRLNKVGELVHRSSEHPNCTRAKVSIHFQEIVDFTDEEKAMAASDTRPAEFHVVPDSEIIVSRAATITNTSTYYLNEKSCQFKDIAAFLENKGIDLTHNRFLILQGEVEQIAMMKPKGQTEHEDGLLEYLEDIIGTSKYVEDILASNVKLEELQDVRNEKVNRLRVIEKEKEGLEDSKCEAEKFVSIERSIMEHKHQVYEYKKTHLEAQKQVLLEEQATLESQYQADQSTIKEEKKLLKTLEKEYQIKVKAQAKEAAELERTKSEYQAFERKDIQLRENVKHTKAQLKKKETQLSKEQEMVEKAKGSQLEIQQQGLPESQAALERAQRQVTQEQHQVEAIQETLKDQTETFRLELGKVQLELEPVNLEVNRLQSEKDTAATEISLLKQEEERAQRRIEETQVELANLRNIVATYPEAIMQTKNELAEAKARGKLVEQEMQLNTSQVEELQQELQQLRKKAAEGRQALSTSTSQTKVCAALNKATQRGGALASTSYFGRLGDCGSIEAKYDVAISTACGALDHFVVQSAEDAETCVAFLREHSLGRATFMILDKIQHVIRKMNDPYQAPKPSERLFDCVKCPNANLRVAFYQALRNTLVTSTLEEASAIQFGSSGKHPVRKNNFRLVTLQGQVIESSGAISGGGRRQKSGRLGLGGGSLNAAGERVSLEEVQASEARVTTLLDQISSLKTQAQAQAKFLNRENPKSMKTLELEIRKTETELRLAQDRVDQVAESATSSLKSSRSEAEVAQLETLEKTLRTMDNALRVKLTQQEMLEVQLSGLQNEIMNIGGEPLALATAALAQARDLEAKSTSDVLKLNVQLKTLDKQLAKSQEKQRKLDSEILELQRSAQSLRDELVELEDQAYQVHSSLELAQERHELNLEHMAQAKIEYDGEKAKIEALTSQASEQCDAREALMNQVKTCRRELQVWLDKSAENLADWTGHKEEYLALMMIDNNSDQRVTGPESESEFELLNTALKVLEVQHQELKGSVTLSVLANYQTKAREASERSLEVSEATSARDAQRTIVDSLQSRRLSEFLAGFSAITLKLKEMYQMITLGGDAELELVDSLDPFREGLVFSVRPSKKSWKNISNLSGGEKTLASLALVFALHHYRPTPLYVMDEIDAALDFKNVSIVGNYIQERTRDAQFIIISLRNNMFELADRLVGIYKTSNATKSVTINPKAYAHKEEEEAKTKVPLVDQTNMH